MLFIGSFTTSSARFSRFDDGNVILFQIIVFARNIKEIKYKNRKYVTKIELYLPLI